MVDKGFRFENYRELINASSQTSSTNHPTAYTEFATSRNPREISISGEINEMTAKLFIRELREIVYDDLATLKANQQYAEGSQLPIDPIRINISTPGGSIYWGLAMLDALDECIAPICTHAMGLCMSMGIFLYLKGDQRTAGKHARFMIHGPIEMASGYQKEVIAYVNESMDVADMLDEIIYTKTTISEEVMREAENCYKFYDYDGALEVGLITDDIYKHTRQTEETQKEVEITETKTDIEQQYKDYYNDPEQLAKDYTKKQLQEKCKDAGLKTSGTKAELCVRLSEFLNNLKYEDIQEEE